MELNLSNLPLEVAIEDIDQYPGEIFTVLRRQGFGGSDASALCGVNPFPNGTAKAVVESKVKFEPTPDELEIGQLRNVRAGTDLEPIIIEKFNTYFESYGIFKPPHMYRFTEHPFLTMNFDGVGVNPEQLGYVPIEIKFVSSAGVKYYRPENAWWAEMNGFKLQTTQLPNIPREFKAYVENKAHEVGIPPYYYTQLNQEMAALDASWGLLCALFETDWRIRVFRADFDALVWAKIVEEGRNLWPLVTAGRAREGRSAEDYELANVLEVLT